MLVAIRQAEARWAAGERPPLGSFQWDTGRVMGDGYLRNTTTYGQARYVEVRIDPSTGRAYTAFPRFKPPGG